MRKDLPALEPEIPQIETILDTWKEALGRDYAAYRNHVYRMVHFCFALHDCGADERRKIAIAAGFHDIGIWSHHTLDYLPPSAALAREYLEQNGLKPWSTEVSDMVELHHKLRAVHDHEHPLVEVFRQADLVDVSMGLVKFGLPAAYVREVKRQFPDEGFHKRLLQLAGEWFSKHPLSPPPFLKW